MTLQDAYKYKAAKHCFDMPPRPKKRKHTRITQNQKTRRRPVEPRLEAGQEVILRAWKFRNTTATIHKLTARGFVLKVRKANKSPRFITVSRKDFTVAKPQPHPKTLKPSAAKTILLRRRRQELLVLNRKLDKKPHDRRLIERAITLKHQISELRMETGIFDESENT